MVYFVSYRYLIRREIANYLTDAARRKLTIRQLVMESWSVQQTKRWIEEHFGQDVGEKFEGEYFTLAIAFSCEYSAYAYVGARSQKLLLDKRHLI